MTTTFQKFPKRRVTRQVNRTIHRLTKCETVNFNNLYVIFMWFLLTTPAAAVRAQIYCIYIRIK